MAHALEVISPVVPQKRHKLATFQSAVWQQNLIHSGPVIAITAALCGAEKE